MNNWVFKMAWRDARSHIRRLLLFVSSIVVGVAAIVSIGSFGVNIDYAVEEQSKTLLGADLLFSSIRAFTPEFEATIDSLGGQTAREFVFGSMARFIKSDEARLVRIRAVEPAFPFYGNFETEPSDAAQNYQTGKNAIVDETLLIQYEAEVGDTIKIGLAKFEIAGKVLKVPNQAAVTSSFNPRIYIPVANLKETGLIERGSRVTRRVYFRFEDDTNPDTLVAQLKPILDENRIRSATISTRKQRVSDVMANLYQFLSLVGFVALVLGSVGVASSVHVYTKQKLSDVAILRCLGAQSRQGFWIYLIQISGMALLGTLFGAGLGVAVQMLLPLLLQDFLPVDIKPFLVWEEVVKGISLGLILALLFALLPLVSIRKISPLFVLRAAFSEKEPFYRDRVKLLVLCLIFFAIIAYASWESNGFTYGLSFTLGCLVAFGVLAAVARALIYFSRRFFPQKWSYVWRQGLSNLFRPNNQTLTLMVSVGLGTFLITTLYLSHHMLLGKVGFAAGENRPNLIFYDIQQDQRSDVLDIVKEKKMPILQEAAIVTMRPSLIKGETVESILQDSTRQGQRGLLSWEFRATYRDSLLDSEEIVAGEWICEVLADEEVVPISMEDGAAEHLNLAVGDTVVWDVQGFPISSRIASLRKVDWQRIQANFMVVFPRGVLEAAPQFFVLAVKAPSAEESALVQRKMVKEFPSVSMVDVALVLRTLDALLDNVAFAVRVIAFFSIFTGLVVLVAAVMTSRLQRVNESVLLRTLGASKKQVFRIMAVEYFFLGGMAACTGLTLSYAASWALGYFVFDSVFVPNVLPFLITVAIVISLTTLIGALNSRGILDRPPLEILRAEA